MQLFLHGVHTWLSSVVLFYPSCCLPPNLSSAIMLLAVKGSQAGLAYSGTGHTNALYAVFFSLSFVVLCCIWGSPGSCWLCCRPQWYEPHQRSEVILTPRYFATVSVLSVTVELVLWWKSCMTIDIRWCSLERFFMGGKTSWSAVSSLLGCWELAVGLVVMWVSDIFVAD